MIVVGICGYAGSGKDETFRKIKKCAATTGLKTERLGFADMIRLEIEEELGVRSPALWKKPHSEAIRWLLQQWGTEFRRAQDPNYWVRRTFQEARALGEAGIDIVAIPDVRYEDEVKQIHDEFGEDGVVIRVTAPLEVRRARLGGALPPPHPTEVIDFEADFQVINDIDGKEPEFDRGLRTWFADRGVWI